MSFVLSFVIYLFISSFRSSVIYCCRSDLFRALFLYYFRYFFRYALMYLFISVGR